MDVRERILEAALELLSLSGAHELTQPRVAKAAGVRQSHLTYYFPTRADLLQAVAHYSIEKLLSQLAHARPGALPVEMATAAADKRRARVMLGLVAAADREAKIKQRLRKFIAEIRKPMAAMLAAGGLMADERSVAFFHSVVIGCSVLQLARDNPAARAEAREVLKLAARFIAK
jgi:AcrR family transcriptional regulator